MRSSRPSCARSRLPQRKASDPHRRRHRRAGPSQSIPVTNWLDSRWRYRQQLIAKWWRRWRSEYHAPEVDQQSRGAGTERPRPDTGGQRPLSAMPPQGREGTFSGQ
ncbi:hypothetical protein T4D_3498 [Trichinella pseudospiralis]|uniref:DUF5641 domain-containing protein n=1 Tax=Trichinella pseudospiralis TaxID=6337 RepID=A0A0V1F9P1_TRIPS|nr:hypothetical protein T4D_3498 [Trichinella pseudospiralis]